MSKPASHDRHGSNAGRGFRYQDAVAAWLAVRIWAGIDQPASIVPEGNDDAERRSSAGRGLVQIKSRREHVGDVPRATAKDYLADLWKRHDKFSPAPPSLELIVEQPLAGHSVATDGRIAPDQELLNRLPGGARGKALSAKTIVRHVDDPREAAITIIADHAGCSPIAAQICFSQMLVEIGNLSDENGRRTSEAYLGLSQGDTERIITTTLEAVDIGAIEQALTDGTCEPIDFRTPLDDPDFYLGVDVQPGHVAAGLVVARPSAMDAVARGLEQKGAVLVAGPSGAGKSAIMWTAAHSLRHTVRWYRLLRVDTQDTPALRRLIRASRASPDAPVGFVVDDVGGRGADTWDALTREFASIPGVLLLGSIREEDLFLIEGRSRAAEMRADPDPDLARRLFDKLKAKGRTTWNAWREPWSKSGGLIMEYVHILTAGERFEKILAEQIDARIRDRHRDTELATLRIASFANASGASVDAGALPSMLGVSNSDVARSLKRLVDEHLVREGAGGEVTGLHQLRSTKLAALTHASPPPSITHTFFDALVAVSPDDLEPLVADASRIWGIDIASVVKSVAERIARAPTIEALAAALRGLGAAHIAKAVDQWLRSEQLKPLPPTQVGTAVMFSFAGDDMPVFNEKMGNARAAGLELAALRADAGSDPRNALLDDISQDTLDAIVASSSGANSLDRLLAALMGLPLHPKMVIAFDGAHVDLLADQLSDVVSFLGSLSMLDRDRAVAMVETVGQATLLERIPREIPWTHDPFLEVSEDGLIVRCDHHHIGLPDDDDTHGKVVRVCEIALALTPSADIAASTARWPNGEPAGFKGHNLAEKRIARQNLPPASLPAWNRRWSDAIAFRIATPSQTEYLSTAADLCKRLAHALERVMKPILNGKPVSDALLEATNEVHTAAERLTPPVVEARGDASDGANIHVTKLQNVLFSASTDIIRRFAKLPEGAPALAMWINDLILDLEWSRASEPWDLIGGAPTALDDLCDVLKAIRDLVGAVSDGELRPSAKYAETVKKARPQNPLRFLGNLIAGGMTRMRDQRASELTAALAQDGLVAEARFVESAGMITPWPPSEAVVLVPIESLNDVAVFALAAERSRELLNDFTRLTIIPSVAGTLIPTWTLSGLSLPLLPPGDSAAAWPKRLGKPSFTPTAYGHFDAAASFALALHSMDSLGLGIAGRPSAEVEAREDLETRLIETVRQLRWSLSRLDPELTEIATMRLDRIRSGEDDLAEAQFQFASRGEAAPLLNEMSALKALMDQAEFDVAQTDRS